MKKPENNEIEVDIDCKVKLLLFDIKNRLIHFDEVVLKARSQAIGKALSAA